MNIFNKLLYGVSASFKDDFRSRRILWSAGSILGAKSVNLLVILISTPLTYHSLGQERFGLLLVVLSLVMLMNFVDLGLGYGLFNRIARYDVAGQRKDLQKAVSSTFFFLVGMSSALFLLFNIAHPFINWGELFNIESVAVQKEARQSVYMFATCFCITLPFTLVIRVQMGFQENHLSQIWEGTGNLFSLAALILVVKLNMGVPIILLAQYGTPCAFIILNFGYQFWIKRKYLMPHWKHWSIPVFKDVWSEARLIFVLQVSNILINALDSVLIARFLGPVAVGFYALGYRLFSIFILPVQAFLNSLLPAFNDAMASKDMAWVMQRVRKTVLGVVITSIGLSLCYFLLANPIISIWISNTTSLSLYLLIAFSAYIAYQNISSLLFNTMLSPVFLKSLFKLFSRTAIAVVLLKILFISFFDYSSLLWATMLGSTVLFLIPGYIQVFNKLRTMSTSTVQDVHEKVTFSHGTQP